MLRVPPRSTVVVSQFVAGGDSYYNTVNNGGTVTAGLSLFNQIESGGILAVYGFGALVAQDTINPGSNDIGGGEAGKERRRIDEHPRISQLRFPPTG